MYATFASFGSFVGKKNPNCMNTEEHYIDSWLDALDMHDKGGKDHSRRVANAAFSFAKDMKLRDDHVLQIYRGALIHDIGKIYIDERIIRKTGRLSDDEWTIMRQHPEYAYRVLRKVNFLQKSIQIPYYHHERWDGDGYPGRLKGKDIPLEARLFAVIDVWDSLSHDRCYHSAWPQEKLLAYLEKQSGKQFDPEIVDRFLENESKYRRLSDFESEIG